MILTFLPVTWHQRLVNQTTVKKKTLTSSSFKTASYLVLPFSLHENKVNPHQRWLGDGELPTYEEVQKGHGILGWGGDPRVPGRHRESEEMQWCEPPCHAPLPGPECSRTTLR